MCALTQQLIKVSINCTLWVKNMSNWFVSLFIRTGWTVVGFGEGCWGAPRLFPPLRRPWRKRCGWSGPGGVLDAAGRSAGSGTTSSASPPWSSRTRPPPLPPQRVGSGASAGSDFPGGLWETASRALCRCSRFRCPTRLQVRWPPPPPAGRRPAAGAGTGWPASRCSLEPQGLPPSQTATRGPPVNHSTLNTEIFLIAKLSQYMKLSHQCRLCCHLGACLDQPSVTWIIVGCVLYYVHISEVFVYEFYKMCRYILVLGCLFCHLARDNGWRLDF